MNGSERKVTIYDVAKEAHVSTGTVSRYLNGVGKSRGDTEERIREAVEKLNFVPNRAARALKSRKHNIICLAYPEADNPFFFELVKEIESDLKKAGYSMMISHTHGNPEEELTILSMTKEGIMDGLILINFNYTPEHLAAFREAECPLVLSSLCVSEYGGNNDDNFDYVGIDVFNGLYMTTMHLIEQGHRKIAFVGGDRNLCVFRERFAGYCSALSRSQIEVEDRYCFFNGYGEASGYESAMQILEMEDRPTAICTVNDVTAIGVMKALKKRGVRIPEDMAVIGLDNIGFDDALTPGLSSAKMMQEALGKCAVDFLLARLRGDRSRSKKIIYQPELVIRESTRKQEGVSWNAAAEE